MVLIYHSVPLKAILHPEYKRFMLSFGAKVKHIIDCKESNDEAIARVKSFNLQERQKQVCPSFIPISKV